MWDNLVIYSTVSFELHYLKWVQIYISDSYTCLVSILGAYVNWNPSATSSGGRILADDILKGKYEERKKEKSKTKIF